MLVGWKISILQSVVLEYPYLYQVLADGLSNQVDRKVITLDIRCQLSIFLETFQNQ
jgi:hypothetical protein